MIPAIQCPLIFLFLVPAYSNFHDAFLRVVHTEKKKDSSQGQLRHFKLPSSILPVPDLSQEMLHVNFLAVHLDHPGMFEHAPWRCSSRRLLFQTAPPLTSAPNHVVEI